MNASVTPIKASRLYRQRQDAEMKATIATLSTEHRKLVHRLVLDLAAGGERAESARAEIAAFLAVAQ